MQTTSYRERRGQLEAYFDRTAVDAWKRLTSDAPVSRIRATVRAGRDQMRALLLGWLPDHLDGARVLDAGCGTGAFSMEAARRGARVVAVDLSPTLLKHARERAADSRFGKAIDFIAGDMLDPALGEFDYVVAMDSLIHYPTDDVVKAVAQLSARTQNSVLFTYAPKTPLLVAMHTMGRFFPRSDRAPAIEPVSERALLSRVSGEPDLQDCDVARNERISSGFYTSQAMELRKE